MRILYLIVSSAWFLQCANGQSKMVAELVPQGRRLRALQSPSTDKSTISSIVIDRCSPETPLEISISAGEGLGVVGLMDNANADIALDFADGTVFLDTARHLNIFSAM